MQEETKEIWKDIKGYEGLYQVSNLGRIKSLPKWHRNNKNSGYWSKEIILKYGKDKDGYLQVMLTKNKNRRQHKIHRLVAQTFIPNPNNYPVVNHKKEFEKQNNEVDNLEWCTVKYNTNYGTAIERRSSQYRKTEYQYTLEGELIKK